MVIKEHILSDEIVDRLKAHALELANKKNLSSFDADDRDPEQIKENIITGDYSELLVNHLYGIPVKALIIGSKKCSPDSEDDTGYREIKGAYGKNFYFRIEGVDYLIDSDKRDKPTYCVFVDLSRYDKNKITVYYDVPAYDVLSLLNEHPIMKDERGNPKFYLEKDDISKMAFHKMMEEVKSIKRRLKK